MKRAIFTFVMLVLMSGMVPGVRDFEDTLISNQGINAQSFDYGVDNPDFEFKSRQEGIYTTTSGTIGADSNSSCPSWATVIDRDGTDGGHLTAKVDSCIVYEYTVYSAPQGGGAGYIADLEPDDVFIEWDEDAGHGGLHYFSFSGEYIEETPFYVQVTGTGNTNWTVYRVTSSGTLTKITDDFNEHDAIHLKRYPTLEKVDDINDGECVSVGDEITYTICYIYPNEPNLPAINNVNFIDYLPGGVEYRSSDPCGSYNSHSHTVIWDIGTLSPGDGGFVTLTVKVNECILGCGIITNSCKIKSGGSTLNRVYENTPVCCASNPIPTCGATVDLDTGELNLIWCPGLFAADVSGHEVYFGTDYNDVNSANVNDVNVYKGTVTNPSYPLPFTSLDKATTYYWRIDEVNTNHPDTRWRGGVWHFTTGNSLVVEDFDSYTMNETLWAIWKDWKVNDSRAAIYLEKGTEDANLVQEGNSMKYWYSDFYAPYYAEAYADIADLPSEIGSDWTVENMKALVLSFYGQSNNDANEPMYVKLHDGDSDATVTYGDYGEDPNNLRLEEWQQWNIDLEDFNSADVDLTNVTRIAIGFGDGVAPGGNGNIYFENIRLYPRRCIPKRPTADLTGDCVVDWRDLKIMTDEWLDMGCSEADLYEDDKVDFKDFAILANGWLEEQQLWPPE